MSELQPMGEDRSLGPYAARERAKWGQPSDLDRFRALFDSVGVKYREDLVAPDIGSDLVVDDLRAQARFKFDASGKFVGYGVRE